jgi:hypothetical protein
MDGGPPVWWSFVRETYTAKPRFASATNDHAPAME